MAEDATAFGFRVRKPGGTLVIELWGELDILAAQNLSTRLTAVARSRHHDMVLVLDLRRVTFVDASGLALLCAVRRQAPPRHQRLLLVSHDPRFSRLLRLAGLADAFTVTDRLEIPVGRARRLIGRGVTARAAPRRADCARSGRPRHRFAPSRGSRRTRPRSP